MTARLSVLDLAPVGRGRTPADALAGSTLLVQEAEALGYERHWVAEHHNMPGIASSSPPVLLAHLAAATSTIRVGSGGLMLPNHAPLAVAEQFGTLEALHPGRIDLGIGRAPGTDQRTASALRRTTNPQELVDEFPEQLTQLLGFFNGDLPEGHPYAGITATPGLGYQPDIWLLGSSLYSAQAAAVLGMPYSFAYHFAPDLLDQALAIYRSRFRPSAHREEAEIILGVSVLCAPTTEEARFLAKAGELAFLRLRQGRPGTYPTPQEAAEHHYTPAEKEFVKARTATHVVGDPDTVRAGLEELAARTGVGELMLSTMTHDPADRRRSYRLVAEAIGLAPGGAPEVELATSTTTSTTC